MAYFNNLDIEIQNQKMEDRKKEEKMAANKEVVIRMIDGMKYSRKKELDRFLHELYGEMPPDFYKGAEAAFEFLWNDIERRIKETMGI